MSNGIGKNPLLDISKVYLQQVVEKKDDSYLEPDMKKRQKNNEKARKDMEKMGTSMKNPHFEETQVVEKLDPVGQEDGDIDNDGDKDSSDKYLMKRRKAIGKALASTKKAKVSEGVRDLDPEKGTAERKARLEKKRGMKMDDHPQFKKPSVKSESFSSWRNDLSEVMTDEMDDKPIKEKKVKNNIKINPKLGEAIEEIGGELIEAVEVDEAVYGGTPAKKEAPKDNRMTVTAADKKANTKAYQNYKAGDKRYKAADHMGEEVVDEALTGQRQMRARDMKGTPYQKGGGKRTARDNKTLHNLATRNEGPGTPGYEKKSTGGKGGKKFAGYGDQGAGNKARRRAGEQPMRGNRDPRNEDVCLGKSSESLEEKAPDRDKQGLDKYDRSKRMIRHKQNKYGTSTFMQRLKTGADHNTDNEKKAKMTEDAAMSAQEVQLQKRKARIDRMIAMKRTQELSKKKDDDEAPAKAMGEGASNPFQVHFDKDGKSYKSKGTKSAADKIATNISANRKKGPMKYDPYKGTDGRD